MCKVCQLEGPTSELEWLEVEDSSPVHYKCQYFFMIRFILSFVSSFFRLVLHQNLSSYRG